jgi:hypothetical protein
MCAPDDKSPVAIERQRTIKTVIFVAASVYLRNNPPAVFSQPEES